MTGLIHGWSRSHLTYTVFKVAADLKGTGSLGNLSQLLLNFQFADLKISVICLLQEQWGPCLLCLTAGKVRLACTRVVRAGLQVEYHASLGEDRDLKLTCTFNMMDHFAGNMIFLS